MENIFGIAAGCLGVVGAATYIYDIYKGKVKPHRFAWVIFWLLSFISFVAQVKLGAKASLYYAGWFVINNTVVVALSLRKNKGYGGIEKENIIGFCLAILGIVLWKSFSSPLLGLLSSLTADAIGASMIIIKSYKYPQTETVSMWILGIAASILMMLSVGTLNFALLAQPMYLFIASGLVVMAITLGKRKSMRKH
jgi:hypothetical protein